LEEWQGLKLDKALEIAENREKVDSELAAMVRVNGIGNKKERAWAWEEFTTYLYYYPI